MDELDRIFGHDDGNPSRGRWFPSKKKDSFVRYFGEFREVCHRTLPPFDEFENRAYQGENKWTISIGGPNPHFQIGYKFFDTVKEAKEWADNRTDDDMFHLETIVDNWRKQL